MCEWPDRFRKAALHWISDEFNEPSRSDYYLMRIAQRVQQWTSSKASVADQRLTFTNRSKAKKPTMEQRVAASKATWMGGVKAYQDQLKANALRRSHGKRV